MKILALACALAFAAGGAAAQTGGTAGVQFPDGAGDSARRVPVPAAQARSGQGTTTVPSGGGFPSVPFVDVSIRNPSSGKEVAFSVQLLLLLTVLSLAPSIIILLTSFLRISIVLDFIRRALSLNSTPPNTVIMGIALFLTVFIMWPVFDKMNKESLQPLSRNEIGIQEAYDRAEKPLRVFMYSQMSDDPENIRLFMSMRGLAKPNSLEDVPTYALVPAFILHELTVAFKMGILLFVPFIIIDMVVASILMSMGMIMLPPVMISMPFKIILFVASDGWNLLTRELIASFGML